jgi:hypothetical protein
VFPESVRVCVLVLLLPDVDETDAEPLTLMLPPLEMDVVVVVAVVV